MTDVIKRLSEYVANQIAAGEVVTAPSSVVKELMENAIDAGASLVIVNVKEGGSELIQIVDDGCGMSFDDALSCFERHATSKISDVNDIYSLSTYGFRGEALASIAAVAEVELLTRREDDELGTRVVIHAGEIKDHSPVACAKGTQFIIKNLFYNIPARRNFLKSKRVETSNIITEFEHVVLSYPKVTFCIYDNEQIVYNLPASVLRPRVSGVLGKQNNAALMDLYIDNDIVEIRGYVGKPESAKKSSPHYMFVNGRYFYKSYFNKAIQLAYEKLMPSDKRYLPPYVLYFTIDASRIDVNVSPSKTEVKFDDEQAVFQILELAVKESLGKNGIVPMIDFEAGSPIDVPLFNEGDDIKVPSLDVNPYFNPFDESFSFSTAVGSFDGSFRSSISENATITGSGSFSIGEAAFENSYSGDDLIDLDISGFNENENATSVNVEREEVFHDVDIEYINDDNTSSGQETFEDIDVSAENIEIRSCNKFKERYLIVSTDLMIFVVHLARASWRVMYDGLMRELAVTKTLNRQKLLFPEEIELSAKHYYIASEQQGDFMSLGFDYSLEESNRVVLNSVPAEGGGADAQLLFEELLDSADADNSTDGYLKTRREMNVARISYIASSAKRNISDKECLYIAETLLNSVEASYAPNGKKILFNMTEDDIEKILK